MNNINADLLLSNKEYLALPKEIKWQVPYLYSFERDGQFLYYFGAKHVMDPKHSQFKFLHEKFQDFLSKNRDKKSVVIYEGNVIKKNLTSLNKAIEQHGESGAIVYWADNDQVPYFRPELTIADETKRLLEEFSQEDIFYFYMMRGIATWLKKVTTEDFDEFVAQNIQRYQKELNWHDFDFSFESSIAKVHKKIFGKEFSLEDKDFIIRVQSSSFKESNINKVSEESCRIRDIAISEHIGRFWHEGYSVFIVYGSYHAKIQERAIKDMVEA
ncbi:hypothetical protein BK005_00725 [bacterium CG10_37_50]|nr:MAG: hypothetical protein BK005_00725 [bacterium CG10_37_50]